MGTARLLGAARSPVPARSRTGSATSATRSPCAGSTFRCSPKGRRPLRSCTCPTCTCWLASSAKQEWIRDLGRLVPDLVVLTGDVLSGADAGPSVLRALAPLLDRPGIFVPGNNDYFEPTLKNPVRYITGSRNDTRGAPIDWPASPAIWSRPAGRT